MMIRTLFMTDLRPAGSLTLAKHAAKRLLSDGERAL
jgi:hypothetical protein